MMVINCGGSGEGGEGKFPLPPPQKKKFFIFFILVGGVTITM